MGQPEDSDSTPHKRCLGCGYILDGLPENRCPECGRGFNPSDPASFAFESEYKNGWAYLAAAVLGAATFVGGMCASRLEDSGRVGLEGPASFFLALIPFGMILSAIAAPQCVNALRGRHGPIRGRRQVWIALLISGAIFLWFITMTLPGLLSLLPWF